MEIIRSSQIAIEVWGGISCLFAVLILIRTRHFDKKGTSRLSVLMVSLTFLLFFDALSWFARGNTSTWGYYAVRIANFCTFLMQFLSIAVFANYMEHLIFRRTGKNHRNWIISAYCLAGVGTVILILSRIFHFMYAFDENNNYYRADYFYLTGAVVAVGLILAFFVLMRYLRYFRRIERISVVTYLSLTIVAVVLQYFFYGVSFGILATAFSTMLLFICHIFDYIEYSVGAQKALHDTRLMLISHRMQPHFIFNSLSVIRHLSVYQPEEAPRAINEFSAFLRGCIDLLNEDVCIPAAKEFDIVRHYIYFQQKRFGDDLNVEYDIRDDSFELPAFTVQNAVENAVSHGLRGKDGPQSGTVTVRSYRCEGEFIVEVEDDGAGFDPEEVSDDGRVHTGIRDTRERLAYMCGGTMEIESVPGSGTKVTVRIPEEKKEKRRARL